MTPHRDKNVGTFVIDRRFPGVDRIKRASGTMDAGVYKSLDAMLTTLWHMGRVDLLRAIQDGKLHVMEVWASFRLGRLNELPDPDSLKPLRTAWGDWIETTDHSSRYQRDMRDALKRLAPKLRDTVIKLPTLVMGYRFECQRKGHGTTFKHVKAISQSFVRDTLGRSHPIYDRLRDIQVLRINRKEGNPQEPDQARAIRDALGEHGHTWWTMCCTGMMPDELWAGKWKVGSNHVHILGTKTRAKTTARNRKVPRICTPRAPTPKTPSGFAKALRKASGGAVKPYDGRRTFIHWVEEAGISRTRRKMYAGHSAKDVTDLYERHELAAYLDTDGARLRAYLAPDKPYLEVMKA